MPRRFNIVILLALANLSVFAVAEAAPSVVTESFGGLWLAASARLAVG